MPLYEYTVDLHILAPGTFPGEAGEAAYLCQQGLEGWALVTVLRVTLDGPPGRNILQEGLAYYWRREV
jgi:hypothetical protein